VGPTAAPRRAGPVAVILVAAACLVSAPASAAPAPDKQTQAAQLAQQLEDQGRRIAVLDEQFNQARARAESLDAELAAMGPRLAESDRQLAAARERLGRTSVDAYVSGGAAPLIGALIRARSDDLGVRRTYINTAMAGQRGALAGYESARRRLLALRDKLRATQRSARATADSLDANRKAAEATIASQQSALTQAQGDLAPLVAEASSQQALRTQQQGRQRFDQLANPPSTGPTTTAPAPRRNGGGPTTTAKPAGTGTGGAAPTTTAPRPASTTTTVPKQPAPAGPGPAVSSGASAAVNTAKAQIGKPYVYGGAGPDNFDCSGLTMYSWRAGGVGLPHSAAMQYSAIAHVALTALQPGDLVFYGDPIYHVGIYVGGGQMIEAAHTGTDVRYASIYRPDLIGAGRP
jgi:cell wall-associated NlpC family hydrolase